ncbi:alpha/beta hydrolase [bacterium]|nr:alpha/beta hydrolase [bacterium]
MTETTEKTIEVNGIKTKYREVINGKNNETILIFHGWGGTSFSWLKTAIILAENGYNSVLLDLPGFGETPPPQEIWGTDEYVSFLNSFKKEMGLPKIFLLGHSFGGALALKYTAKHESEIKKLILCDAAVIRKERLNFRQKTAKFLSKMGSKIVSRTPFYHVFEKIAYKLAGTYDYYRANPIMREIFKKIIIDDMSDLAETIKIPVLILWGEIDKATPIEDAFVLNEIINNSELKVINGSGHNPHRTHSEETAKIITNYLKK